MSLVRSWELIALDDLPDGGQQITAVADAGPLFGMRLVTTRLELSDDEARALRARGLNGPVWRPA